MMHDIDRTQLETSWDSGEFGDEWELDYSPEMEGEMYEDPYGEMYEDPYGEMYEDPYGEMYEDPYGEMYEDPYGEVGYEDPFSEAEEMELAMELLAVGSEAELDQFLGKLFRKVGRAFKKVVRLPFVRKLGRALKGIARKALPMVGGALGSMIPIPGVGTAVGASLGSAAGRMFGLELEGMSPEDQEFEIARRYVRLAGDAARIAALAPPGAPANQVVNKAIAASAQRHAPGLVRGRPRRPARGKSGRWVRRGRHIILINV